MLLAIPTVHEYDVRTRMLATHRRGPSEMPSPYVQLVSDVAGARS
jgi:hypothetical protein